MELDIATSKAEPCFVSMSYHDIEGHNSQYECEDVFDIHGSEGRGKPIDHTSYTRKKSISYLNAPFCHSYSFHNFSFTVARLRSKPPLPSPPPHRYFSTYLKIHLHPHPCYLILTHRLSKSNSPPVPPNQRPHNIKGGSILLFPLLLLFFFVHTIVPRQCNIPSFALLSSQSIIHTTPVLFSPPASPVFLTVRTNHGSETLKSHIVGFGPHRPDRLRPCPPGRGSTHRQTSGPDPLFLHSPRPATQRRFRTSTITTSALPRKSPDPTHWTATTLLSTLF